MQLQMDRLCNRGKNTQENACSSSYSRAMCHRSSSSAGLVMHPFYDLPHARTHVHIQTSTRTTALKSPHHNQHALQAMLKHDS